MRCLWQGVKAMFRGLAFTFSLTRLRWFRFPNLVCAFGGFVYFICALGVGFGRFAAAVVSCERLAGSVCHTATALFK